MSSVDIFPLLDQLSRLKEVESEYRVTLPVLAIVTERLLDATGADAVVIGAGALMDSPDLEARREGENIVIRVAR